RGASPGRAFALGWLAGLAAALAIFSWVLEVPAIRPLHVAILGSYLALYTALWCAALPILAQSPMPLVFTAPACWGVLEFVRAHAGFLAFGWGTLGQTQHANLPVLQLAAVTGEAGVAFLVVMSNVAVAGLLRERGRWDAILAGAIVAIVHLGGFA